MDQSKPRMGNADADYHIRHESTHLEWQPRVLKQGDSFAVLNPYGDIITLVRSEEGLFHQDTRFLSHYELRIDNTRPQLLASHVARDNTILHVHLRSPSRPGVAPHEGVYVSRSIYLWQNALHERLFLRNYGPDVANLLIQYIYDADFADIFEVRGEKPRLRGTRLRSEVSADGAQLRYQGRDQESRSTHIKFEPTPQVVSPSAANHLITLANQDTAALYSRVACKNRTASDNANTFAAGLRAMRRRLRTKRNNATKIHTSNELFNEWLNRSFADLYTLITETPNGYYPYAGIPWFSTPFGRDGILTALQCLWMDPSIARGVLSYLAKTQATELIRESDAEPGKILHETRRGEMANLGEVPFGKYYGSVDATPLFVVLAGEYFSRTGDRRFIEAIWPNVAKALEWIDRFGDADGDGFVEYSRSSSKGLVNQGWKDSNDSVFHDDGTLAKGPIALCEVQGYTFSAKHHAASLAEVLGFTTHAAALRAQAESLREKFEEAFWIDRLGTYAIALDGNKQRCAVRSSNAGQVLFSGIASEERAGSVMDLLTSGAFYSGWGIRTLAKSEPLYNPMSYHNGSIWPHDNALISLGCARYNIKKPIMAIMKGLFEASVMMELHRLPELFCGFSKRAGMRPILYPNACAPQAWSSATPIALLGASLGIGFHAPENQILIHRPHLPTFLEHVQLRGLTLGEGSADLAFKRSQDEVFVVTESRRGNIDIVITS